MHLSPVTLIVIKKKQDHRRRNCNLLIIKMHFGIVTTEYFLSVASTSPPPQDQRRHHRNDQAGHQRKMQAEALAHDVDVARQAAERQAPQPGSGEAGGQDQDSGNDEQALHVGAFVYSMGACYTAVPHRARAPLLAFRVDFISPYR